MKVAYKGDTRVTQVRVQAFRREFEHMEMNENEGVVEFIARVQKMVNQLRMNGEEVPPNRVAEKIFRNLTNDFESIVVTIEETKDLSTLTVDELLRAEVLATDGEEAEDEVDVAEAVLRMIMKSKPVSRIGVTEDKEKVEEIGRGDRSGVECFKCGKYGHKANECRLSNCYNCGKAGHIAKYCKTETKGETNLLIEDAEEECGILLMAKSSDAVDMENPIPTMDEVISVKDATIVEKKNLEKELKQKDEEIQRIGRLLDEANEKDDEDVKKNPVKKSAKIVEKSPKVGNELVKVIEKSGITKSVRGLKRSTKVKGRRAIRKNKKSNLIERSKLSVG
ncbi:uncharacterized protein LOC124822224 [Vigna umbellata]|uniref:uncharacterized protein LOC124822224 n=1 Tax=Vigna umbellata TaxID=87088 RepID=UPI001F5EEB96|nr:uncharacterized protein LOC124822224 [Vigna umbellata]